MRRYFLQSLSHWRKELRGKYDVLLVRRWTPRVPELSSFWSKCDTTKEKRIGLAMNITFEKYCHYLFLSQVVLYVNHILLRYLIKQSQIKWYNCSLDFITGRIFTSLGKAKVYVDHLSKLFEGVEPMNNDFLNASLFVITLIWTNCGVVKYVGDAPRVGQIDKEKSIYRF